MTPKEEKEGRRIKENAASALADRLGFRPRKKPDKNVTITDQTVESFIESSPLDLKAIAAEAARSEKNSTG